MQQQKQYTEIIVQASPDWYVTYEPHQPIKAPVLDFVLIFRLSNGQEQGCIIQEEQEQEQEAGATGGWTLEVMVLEFLMVPLCIAYKPAHFYF